MGKLADKAVTFFNALNKDTMHLVPEFYAPQAAFFDPLVNINSAEEIQKYYQGLYANVQEIKFEFSQIVEEGNRIAAPWIMHLRTTKLNSGETVSVPGMSHIQFDEQSSQAVYHRDYFDMGAFIYEYVPVLGMVIRIIKRKLH